jgi:hypothetical protein
MIALSRNGCTNLETSKPSLQPFLGSSCLVTKPTSTLYLLQMPPKVLMTINNNDQKQHNNGYTALGCGNAEVSEAVAGPVFALSIRNVWMNALRFNKDWTHLRRSQGMELLE